MADGSDIGGTSTAQVSIAGATDVEFHLRRLAKLRGERGTLEAHWQEIAEVTAPMRADFNLQRSMGEKRMQKVFDGTAGIAADNLASGLYGNISSPSNDWFELAHEDADINEDHEVRTWLSAAADRMRQVFGANGGRFYAKIMPLYRDLITFGTGVFYAEKIPGRASIYYSTRHLAECYLVQNAYEQVDTMYSVFKLDARAIRERFGDLPDQVKRAEATEPDRLWEFLHIATPNQEYRPGALGPRGFQTASLWIFCEGEKLMKESGFIRFPFMAPRWSMPSVGAYGDSQAMLALPDTKMLNALRKVNLVGLQKVVDPTILSADERALRGWTTNPGGTVYGGLDENGNARYKPLMTGARPDIGVDYEERIRESIREAFHATRLMMDTKAGATATEVLARQDEKLRQLGPNLGLVQSEFLDPMIDWQFATMLEGNAFKPLPQKLADYPSINVRYVSPLARAQKAGEGAAIIRSLEAIKIIGEQNPDVYDNVDFDEAVRLIFNAFGAHPKTTRDPKVVEMIRKTKAGQDDVASMMAAAGPVSGAMKNMAQAQQAMTQMREAA